MRVDGGSEFQSVFEETYQRLGILLFTVKRYRLLPPRSPKLNGYAERADQTHTEEFTVAPTVYEITVTKFDLPVFKPPLRQWETTYNTVRPYQALGYLTPHQFLLQNYSSNGKDSS